MQTSYRMHPDAGPIDPIDPICDALHHHMAAAGDSIGFTWLQTTRDHKGLRNWENHQIPNITRGWAESAILLVGVSWNCTTFQGITSNYHPRVVFFSQSPDSCIYFLKMYSRNPLWMGGMNHQNSALPSGKLTLLWIQNFSCINKNDLPIQNGDFL